MMHLFVTVLEENTFLIFHLYASSFGCLGLYKSILPHRTVDSDVLNWSTCLQNILKISMYVGNFLIKEAAQSLKAFLHII